MPAPCAPTAPLQTLVGIVSDVGGPKSIMPDEENEEKPKLYWKTCTHQATHACVGMAWAEKSMTNLCDDCKAGKCS